MSVILGLSTGVLSSFVFEILNRITKEYIKEKKHELRENDIAEDTELYLTNRDIEKLNEKEEKKVIEKSTASIEHVRKELLRQAKLAFNCAIFTILFGVLLIGIGAIFLMLGNITVSVFTSISGAISELLSYILIKFSNRSNDKLEKIKQDLNKLESARIGLEMVENIENKEDKDKALKVLIESISKGVSEVA